MPLVFSAIVPHSPVLLPNAPKVAYEKLIATRNALKVIAEELYVAKPTHIIIISPHASLHADAFTIHTDTEFYSFFEEFGDVATQKTWNGSPEFAAKISHHHARKNLPIQLNSHSQLDHGTSIPLLWLTEHLPTIKVVPIGFSNLSPKMHLEFGELLKEVIAENSARVAVIASADLSHNLATDSPAPFNPHGKDFDNSLIELLCSKNTIGVATMDQNLIRSADECGYRAILVLLGVLVNWETSFKVLAYESPFGIGYLTGIFNH